jgi:hypothetical protein
MILEHIYKEHIMKYYGYIKNYYMFNYATSFNQDLSEWDLTKKNTIDMFKDCPIKDEYKPKMK